MNSIPAEIVEEMRIELSEMSPDAAPDIIDRMSNEQPLVLAYLMAIGDNLFNQDERELFVFLGVVIWQIMSQGDTPLPQVTEKMIDEIEESNFKMLEYLEDESEADFIETTDNMLENYNQQEVLKYVIEVIMEEPEEDCEITEESQGLMMIYLKTVIDCFDR